MTTTDEGAAAAPTLVDLALDLDLGAPLAW
jgi:hypothetical protein